MNTRILPYFPSPSPPIRGATAAEHFDADVFDHHPSLDAYCRPIVELEFTDAPDALRNALAIKPMDPFRFVVEVTRGTGMFTHHREVLQVRTVEGFEPSLVGILQGGFLSNGPDRQPEPMSKGEASHLLYSPPSK